jgi:taurine dioxygenase
LPVEDIDGDDPEIVLIQASKNSNFVAGESWHTDGTAAAEPAWAQMLYITQTPGIGCGGDTMFANMQMAYEMLSAPMKAFLEPLTAIHDAAVPWAGYEAPPNLPKTEHRVVMAHPETGAKMLFVNPGFTTHIVQLAAAESRAVLDMLFGIVDREHALSCRIRWQPNTVVFWDNRCTQHRAIWDYYPHDRYGERVTLLGAPVRS